jgi:hypothetical protein
MNASLHHMNKTLKNNTFSILYCNVNVNEKKTKNINKNKEICTYLLGRLHPK